MQEEAPMTAMPAAARGREIRVPPDPKWQKAALDSFDGLLPGESLIVLASAKPREFLNLL